jgi:hypothetical protein
VLCPVQVNARIRAHCEAIHAFISFLQNDLRRFFFGARLAFSWAAAWQQSHATVTTAGGDQVIGYKKLVALSLMFTATGLASPSGARGQSNAFGEETNIRFGNVTQPNACGEPSADKPAKAALRLVCLRERLGADDITLRNVIVIGFVGGFVKHDDMRHPEVQFAAWLRQSYASVLHAEVFANHDSKRALRRVLSLLNTDTDGVITNSEREQASIIIYGHSWGASQAVTLARELGKQGIPVLLTVQVDSVHKPGRNDSTIPSNVRSAVNFYQLKGLIHGRSRIRADNPERTSIIGNFETKYQKRQINCDNYPWLARHVNRGHHEIENDPLVWEQIASLIDSELSKGTSAVEASMPSSSLPVK